ncbi:hypothetical protein [Sporomusa aerivorans]|uniref:hypothetical protein n=1 Tax=Sporomusa aerivorans TaxID=204936 RepID=UPI00352AAA1B
MKFPGKIIGVSLTLAMMLVFSGCANKDASPVQESLRQQIANDAAAKEKSVMGNFTVLIRNKEATAAEVVEFIDNNITTVSADNASTMVIGLEKIQKEKLPKLQDEFAASEASQKVLAKSPVSGVTDSFISNVDNQAVKELLLETKNGGFKIETAEGMYFPVIDYSLYRKYQSVVTQDMAAFIDIMAIESDKTPSKDAALVISWADILNRALTQERFIKEYGNSVKVADIRQLLNRYTAFALYGANNTPLFSYDTGQMAADAKNAYSATLFDAANGSFSQVMSGYLNILKKNDYKLTDEIQQYRNNATKEIR